MLSSRPANSWLQSDFYRDQYRKMLRFSLIVTGFVILLSGLAIYSVLFRPAQAYYANTSEGKILPMPAVKIG